MAKKPEQIEEAAMDQAAEAPATEEVTENQDQVTEDEPETTDEDPAAEEGPDSEEVPAEVSEAVGEDAPAATLPAEAKAALESEYPVLREHGSHNAAVNGLQSDASGGYDRSKL